MQICQACSQRPKRGLGSVPNSRFSTLFSIVCRLMLLFALTGSSAIFAVAADPLQTATASPLFARGYTVIPEPQKVTLTGQDFEFSPSWRLELGPGVEANDIAVASLKQELQERFHLALSEAKGKGGPGLKLAIDPQAVEIGAATDRQKPALAEQAYRMKLRASGVTITGNSSTGLFYGVQTLVQLLKPQQGKTLVAGRGDYGLAGPGVAGDLLG